MRVAKQMRRGKCAKNDALAITIEQRLINMIYDVMVYDFDAGI